MAKTRNIIQAKEFLYMQETNQAKYSEPTEPSDIEPTKSSKPEPKFKETVCPKVPSSYFKRARKQKG